MSQFTNELCGIAAEIANGTYTRKDVKNKLDTLERAYPEETYMVYPVARKDSHGIWRISRSWKRCFTAAQPRGNFWSTWQRSVKMCTGQNG